MGIGGSIFLIALGAIVAFGVQADLGWLDLDVVGWVLMLAGVVGLGLTWSFWNRRRSRRPAVAERHVYHDPTTEPRPTREERDRTVERY